MTDWAVSRPAYERALLGHGPPECECRTCWAWRAGLTRLDGAAGETAVLHAITIRRRWESDRETVAAVVAWGEAVMNRPCLTWRYCHLHDSHCDDCHAGFNVGDGNNRIGDYNNDRDRLLCDECASKECTKHRPKALVAKGHDFEYSDRCTWCGLHGLAVLP